MKRWVLGIAAFLGALLLWIVFRRRINPLDRARLEMDAIEAENRAKKAEAELGRERALLTLREEHREQLQRLSAAEKQQAEELSDDPKALARYLVMVGSRYNPGGNPPGKP